jgi:hypothetical protein
LYFKLTNIFLVTDPDDADATILTGLNKIYNNAFIGAFVTALAPANTVNPAKWSKLNSGYLAFFNQTSFEEGFYYPGEFDQGLINLDFEIRGTAGVGELDSALALGPVVATTYKNPILDITGMSRSGSLPQQLVANLMQASMIHCFVRCPTQPKAPSHGRHMIAA